MKLLLLLTLLFNGHYCGSDVSSICSRIKAWKQWNGIFYKERCPSCNPTIVVEVPK